MKREELIETAARAIYEARNGHGCYPWRDRTKNHKTPYLADASAVLSAIEASGHAVVPMDSVAARDAVSAAIARDEPSWRVWREGVEAGKL